MTEAARKLLRKVAAEAYDHAAGEGASFDLEFVRAMVAADASTKSLGQQIVDLAIQAAVEYVDEQRRDRPEQCAMFGDLERVLAIGDGVRRRKANCRAQEMAAHMQIVNANAARVAAAAAREQDEYAQLLPYLNEGMTVAEAVQAIEAER